MSNDHALYRNSNSSGRGIQALGSLSSINPELRNNCQPLSMSYLCNPMSNTMGTTAPPLPPRRLRTPMNHLSPMNSFYGGFSRYSPFSYGPSYGNYRMSPYGQFGASSDPYSSFIQMAEESTRPAFESIESVVQVVSSISMMLESTYQAVYSSYSAIIGVVDQFSKLKDHLAQIFSVLALLRGLRWLCLKVLYLLGVKSDDPSINSAWSSAELNSAQNLNISSESQKSAWPFFMFLGLVIGAPWLMFKLLSRSVSEKPFNDKLFQDQNGKYMKATAAYDFTSTQRGELSFRAGEKLLISPKAPPMKGWLLACNGNNQTGLIPANYLAVKAAPKKNIPVAQYELVNTVPFGEKGDAVADKPSEMSDSVVDVSSSSSILQERSKDSNEL